MLSVLENLIHWFICCHDWLRINRFDNVKQFLDIFNIRIPWKCNYPHFPKIILFQMLTFLEKNSKERSKARLGAVSAGAKSNAVAAAEAILDSVPASGTMSQTEVNEVSCKIL